MMAVLKGHKMKFELDFVALSWVQTFLAHSLSVFQSASDSQC